MKPRQFDYVRADTIDEALACLAEYGNDARILAGGQSQVPMLNFRLIQTQVLIDINRIEDLNYIRVENGALEIGAATCQVDLLDWPDLASTVPLLAVALPYVGHFQTRNRGTVCGSIAHSDPSSELPLSLATLEGEVVLQSGTFPTTNIRFLRRFGIGDVNCDGGVDAFDIEPFLLALFDLAQYTILYPNCLRSLADTNQDGQVNAFDIEGFLEILFP